LAQSNTKQTTLFEDSLKAYYAAESGVEAALLEWRFNHDAELWNKTNAEECALEIVYGDPAPEICEKVIMTKVVTLDRQSDPGNPVQDITDQIYDADGQVKADASYPVNQPWYELRMYFRDPYQPTRGSQSDPADVSANPIRINKDETFEIRFPDDDIYNMLWKPTYETWQTEGDQIRLLWEPVVTDMSGKEVLYDDKDLSLRERQYFSDFYSRVFSSTYSKAFRVDSSKYSTGVKVLRITAQISTDTTNPNSEYDNKGDKKGVYLFLKALDDGSTNMIHIPDNEVTIEVVGHYNNISRSLKYTLDRQSGTIMDIFDYGVYSKEDFVK